MSPFKQASLAGDHNQLRSSWSKYSYWPCPLLSRGVLITWCQWNCTWLSPLAWSRLLVVRKCRFCSRKVLLPTTGRALVPNSLLEEICMCSPLWSASFSLSRATSLKNSLDSVRVLCGLPRLALSTSGKWRCSTGKSRDLPRLRQGRTVVQDGLVKGRGVGPEAHWWHRTEMQGGDQVFY